MSIYHWRLICFSHFSQWWRPGAKKELIPLPRSLNTPPSSTLCPASVSAALRDPLWAALLLFWPETSRNVQLDENKSHKQTQTRHSCFLHIIYGLTHTHASNNRPPTAACCGSWSAASVDWLRSEAARRRRKQLQAMSSRGGEDLSEISAPWVFLPRVDRTCSQTASAAPRCQPITHQEADCCLRQQPHVIPSLMKLTDIQLLSEETRKVLNPPRLHSPPLAVRLYHTWTSAIRGRLQ